MAFLLRLVTKLPVPTGVRLGWQRTLLDRAYGKDIIAARKLKDWAKVHSLKQDHRVEIDLHDEEEDEYLSKSLIAKARQIRVPVPHKYKDDKTESEHWYEGHYTGQWYLTTVGVSALRDEIRRELIARHDLRAKWVVWLTGITGIIGAITGLVAAFYHKA
ncbi:hypothetical protein [Ferrovum myxofaciens]|uniref:hypothetical protein n=1 Tax=Ferrovum myxofaciens TaxID=416213 RepID=UPI0004E25BC7|nr:hypothetical protein [Ferrovum myxofaciens]